MADEHLDSIKDDVDWEPMFGTKFTGEHFKLFKSRDFVSDHEQASMLGSSVCL
jgi:hypothetical protein